MFTMVVVFTIGFLGAPTHPGQVILDKFVSEEACIFAFEDIEPILEENSNINVISVECVSE